MVLKWYNSIISVYLTKGLFWIRLFGVGFSIRNVCIYWPIFSERYGYTKLFRLGRYGIKYLPKWR